MKSIGLIDDNNSQRRAMFLKVKLKLEQYHSDWRIVESKPFKEVNDYRLWILENELSVLIIDERLNDGLLDDGTHAKYLGSDLVISIRQLFKDFPVFCVTSYDISDELKKSQYYFHLILKRDDFFNGVDSYLNLFVKSGAHFYREYEKELARLGVLSEKVAVNEASDIEKEEIKSIQINLVIPHIANDLTDKENSLNEIESRIKEIKEMQKELLTYLNK